MLYINSANDSSCFREKQIDKQKSVRAGAKTSGGDAEMREQEETLSPVKTLHVVV